MIKIEFYGMTLDVDFDYQPAERQTRDYPGCGEFLQVTEVKIGDQDASEFFLEYDLRLHTGSSENPVVKSLIRELEEAVLDALHSSWEDQAEAAASRRYDDWKERRGL